MIDPYQKVCKYEFCKRPFEADRLNQEYCKGRKCKVRANNWKAREIRNETRVLDRIQHKNREVLKELHKENIGSIEYSVLSAKGFKIQYHTHKKKLKEDSGKYVVFYYEFGLIPVNDNSYKIVRDNAEIRTAK